MSAPILPLYFGAAPSDRSDGAGWRASRRTEHRVSDDAPHTPPMPMGDADDLLLARRVREGDASAFDTLVETHLTALVRFAFRFVQTRDAAEDVVQDVLAHVWSRRDRLPVHGSVRAFLFTAVRNQALDHLKHQRADERARGTFAADARDAASVEALGTDDSDEEMRGLLVRVHDAMRALPERQHTALALRYGQSMRVAEVAVVLDVSVKAAEQLLVRALRHLRAAVGDDVRLI